MDIETELTKKILINFLTRQLGFFLVFISVVFFFTYRVSHGVRRASRPGPFVDFDKSLSNRGTAIDSRAECAMKICRRRRKSTSARVLVPPRRVALHHVSSASAIGSATTLLIYESVS